MASTGRFVTKSTPHPNSSTPLIEYTGIMRTRRHRIGHFQCCMSAFILNETSILSESIQINSTPILMKISNEPLLNMEEWAEAIQAGERAIVERNLFDASAQLFNPHYITPYSRHRTAVNTSPHARTLALAGVAEIEATRHIEKMRKDKKKNSAMGAFFDGKWTFDDRCNKSYPSYCDSIDKKFRMYNGSCNHQKNRGAAFTDFSRLLPPDYADGIEKPRVSKSGKPLPSAREVSLRIHNPIPSVDSSFTVMLAVFGQFVDHDMTATAISQGINGSSLACCGNDSNISSKHPECFPVIVGHGDPVYDVKGSTCMEFVRSAPVNQCKLGPRQQLNQVTSFIDGSAIYGSDQTVAFSLRTNKSGQLRMFTTADGRSLLPPSTDPYDGCNNEKENKRGRYCFATGDPRANENLHLTSMHLLWARQHNFIANKLKALNPTWNDEKIYQETRRIIGAQLQHITYNEFLPIILGDDEMKKRKLNPLKGKSYRHNQRNNSNVIDSGIANCFASAAFRFAHSLLPSLMKISDEQKNTQDYIELHKMLFNPYSLYNPGGIEQAVNSAASNFIQKTSTHVTSQLTHNLFQDPLVESDNKDYHWMTDITNHNNNSDVTATLPHIILPCGLDLVSLNIQRGRDHGLPSYTVWREYCHLTRPRNFKQLKNILDSDNLKQIQRVYEDVDDIDLYTGALSEIKSESNGLVGPTFTCLIADQFQRLQLGDQYWYEFFVQPYPFTPEQLYELRKSSLAKLICDCSDNISRIQPQVMRSSDSTSNPITSCKDIAGPDFTAWKESN